MPEQVVPFLLHDDAIVRNHALNYFKGTHDFGPLTADHFWAVIDKFGQTDQTIGFAAHLRDVPQTEASLHRLLKALASKPSAIFDFHYQHAAYEMDLNLVAEHREELLSAPQLVPHVREHLELRLSLIDRPPEEAWDRLMEHGRELAEEYALSFNYSQSDALIEAAARGGATVCEQALTTLADESAAEDWRQIFAVKVLGAARYEPAIDALVNLLAIDTDVLRQEVNRALARIGTLSVIERLVSFYPGKPWHVRLYAHAPISNIKRSESVSALLKLLDVETALDADPSLSPEPEEEGEPLVDWILVDLTELCSLAALDQSRALIEEFPDDPELVELCEGLLATALMTGAALPEESFWRRRLKRRDAEIRSIGGLSHWFSDTRENWRNTGISYPSKAPHEVEDPATFVAKARTLNQDLDSRDTDVEPNHEPYRNPTPKVGRNDPCPCGSGKKYKKCCGK
ncbi:MAG TPA: SEC-C metal-binding domain-containing protein [Humisphaera sp.]|nr:SEC-C metal-binding domain-containing protein [Humisphaera sp.]